MITDRYGTPLPYERPDPECTEYRFVLNRINKGTNMDPTDVLNFISDVNKMLDIGMWFSDACVVVLKLKEYDVTNTKSEWWDDLLFFCVPERPPVTDSSLFED